MMKSLQTLFGILRIVLGVSLLWMSFTFPPSIEIHLLQLACLTLTIGFFSRTSMIAVFLLVFVIGPRPGDGLFFAPLFLAFGSGPSRFSIDRLIATLRGKIPGGSGHQSKKDALQVYFDGHCMFCRRCVEVLKNLDSLGNLSFRDFRSGTPSAINPEQAEKEIIVLRRDGVTLGGFHAFREMAKHVPVLIPIFPFLFIPGIPWLGVRVYRWVADHRTWIMGASCESDVCSRE